MTRMAASALPPHSSQLRPAMAGRVPAGLPLGGDQYFTEHPYDLLKET
jgi:hypothetical protein